MAPPAVGVSLGQNPFKVQDTFTWEDLRCGVGGSSEQARHSWEINALPKNEEAHFFDLRMTAFEDRGKFSMVLSVCLTPWDYLVFSETVSFRAAEVEDLVPLIVAYLKELFGTATAKRIIRRYGGKMLEWLQSVAAIYREEAGNETNRSMG